MFLPNDCKSCVNLMSNGLLFKETNGDAVVRNVENENGYSVNGLRGRKKPHFEDVDSECRRGTKQPVVYDESTVISEMFDKMLLSKREEAVCALREALQNKVSKNVKQNILLKGSNGEKKHCMKRVVKRDLVDLKTLLILCAQAIATDNRNSADDLFKQIRQHSSPTGDGMQRLASYFADGLEARLAGYGTQRYTELLSNPITAVDVLKSHYFFFAVCPIVRISYFFCNKTIMHAAERATRLHIIHFGISYGFQWPSFIEQLSCRPGGPPKLRITGIDFPHVGLRPTKLIEETGWRLTIYAERFNVPFEFNAIAKKWETIRKEDIKIEGHEVLAVNCIYKFRYVPDESVRFESPRNTVLKLIKDLNPDIFVQGVTNGAQSSPFFLNRFQEAIFYYSAMFDMCENIAPREAPERKVLEKELLGREIMNLVAFEGFERVERPETYKQWQARKERAGFKLLPLNKEVIKVAAGNRVASVYHKDFLVDEDGQWLLVGWKGRILNALSSCKPIRKSNSSSL